MSYLRVSLFGFPPASWARKYKEVCERRKLVKLRRYTTTYVDRAIREAAKNQNYVHVLVPDLYIEEIISELKKKGYIIDRWKDYSYSDGLRYTKFSIQWHEWPAV